MLPEDGLYIRGMHLTWRERTDIWPNHRSVAAVNSKQRSFLRSRIYRSAMVFFQKLRGRDHCILASSVRSCGCCPLHGPAVLAIHMNDTSQWETWTQRDGEDGLFYLMVNYLL